MSDPPAIPRPSEPSPTIAAVEGDDKRAPTAIERATLREDAEKSELAATLATHLDSNRALVFAEAFTLARNFRDLVYGLKEQGRLDPKDVARQARGPATAREVRALADYVVPHGVDTAADYLERHPNRPLAKKPRGFLRHARAAALLAGLDPRDAIIRLAKGTSFWPTEQAVVDGDRAAAVEVATLLADVARDLGERFCLTRYFDLVATYDLRVIDAKSGVAFEPDDKLGVWRHLAIPAIPVAVDWKSESKPAVLVVPGPDDDNPDFEVYDRLLAADQFHPVTIRRYKHFAIGVARFGPEFQAVGVVTHSLMLPFRSAYGKVARQSRADSWGTGWERVELLRPHGRITAAWTLEESLRDPAARALEGAQDERVPDVEIVRITPEFLLAQHRGRWAIDQPSRGDGWRFAIDSLAPTSRLGGDDALAALIERSLLTEALGGGPVADVAARCAALVAALTAWKTENDRAIAAGLERVRRVLGGALRDD
jgi:hypothetical protein